MNGQMTNTPVVLNSDSFNDHAPLDEARIRQELITGAIVDVAPLEEALILENLIGGGTVVDVDPLDESIVDVLPMDETLTHEALIDTNVGSLAALLDRDVSEHLRTRWNEIQGRFVDDPRSAVQQADALVSEVVEKITQLFADERGSLEGQWKEGNDVSTEDLRQALQHYRSFFNRLVV